MAIRGGWLGAEDLNVYVSRKSDLSSSMWHVPGICVGVLL